jgi:ribosomal protein S18 acetylase RimI-like enzyme
VLDFYLAGIKKKYQGKGIDLMLVIEIVKMALEKGFNYAESNLELENNTKVQALWKHFNPVRHRIRRIYRKNIDVKS